MTDRYTPWGKRHTGGPRGWAALAIGVSFWQLANVMMLAGVVLEMERSNVVLDWPRFALVSTFAAFLSAVFVIPAAYAGLKRCYDRPPPEPGDNVTVTTRERAGSNRIGGRRMMQTGPTTWKIVDDLPEGVSTSLMEDWMLDVWRERASWNVPSGRERGLDDGQVKRVKEWLEDRKLISIAANGQWDWTDRGEGLCEDLERGYDLGRLLDGRPTETEV